MIDPGEILATYADRGVFKGFSRGPSRNGRSAYKIVWHRNREFEIAVDERRIHCPAVLPQVDARSKMWRDLRAFIADCQSDARPDHRRIDPAKAPVACANRAGNVSLTMRIAGGDVEYAVRKFIHLIQEIYLVFLTEHFDYQVEAFDLDPDRP